MAVALGGVFKRVDWGPICQGERPGQFFRPSCQQDFGRNDAAQALERQPTVAAETAVTTESGRRTTLSFESAHSTSELFPGRLSRVLFARKSDASGTGLARSTTTRRVSLGLMTARAIRFSKAFLLASADVYNPTQNGQQGPTSPDSQQGAINLVGLASVQQLNNVYAQQMPSNDARSHSTSSTGSGSG
uniref:Uncharacterized protein n=1 Tax=Plectus sambesii TaxID=2011161 RepID=A0A914X6M4_9BILA